jgi:hypothetical protein
MSSHQHAVPTIFYRPGAPDFLVLAAHFSYVAPCTIKEYYPGIPASESKKAD